RFTHLSTVTHPSLSNDGIVAITQDNQGDIALITKNFELNIFDEEADTFRSYVLSNYLPDKRPVVNIGDLSADPREKGEFWISALEGIFRFNAEREEFSDLLFQSGWTPVNFKQQFADDHFLWVGLFEKGGLLKIEMQEPFNKWFYTIDTSFQVTGELDTRGLANFSVWDLAIKSQHELYVATANRGIAIFNANTGQFDFNRHKSKILETDFVRSVSTNSSGEFWAGADIGGLFYLRPESAHFKTRLFPEQHEVKSQFRMIDVLPIEDSLYLMTFFRHPEIWLWNRKNDLFQKIMLESESRYGGNMIKYQDKSIIGCSFGGVDLYDPASKKMTKNVFDLPPNFRHIHKMLADSTGLWFITWGIGLAHYQDSLTQFIGNESEAGLRHAWTHDIAFGPDSCIWVGQENGLYSINKYNHIVRTFAQRDDLKDFDNPNFKALEFDWANRLWVGNFGSGLSCFDIKTRDILYKINVSRGLPSDRVYDMIVDDAGFIWVWTSDGLCSFYPEIDPEAIKLKYYPESKFLPVDRSGIWFTKLPDGEIFFGVSGGFVHFDPARLREDQDNYLDAPVLTDFKAFDRGIPFRQKYHNEEPIYLKPKQNFFSISFSAPKSGFLSRQQFNYRLEGIDQDWVNSENRRVATYTGVPPGNYQFFTRVGTQNGIWSEASSPLLIVVNAPWYATLLAKIIWLVLIISFIYGLNRVFVIRERMQAQLKMQGLEAQNLRELDQAKSHFFTQISHEFRTPLTVILGMVDLLRSQINGSQIIGQKISAIERNGMHLLRQINQILDLSRLQTKTVQLDLIQSDVISYINYIIQSFLTYAESKKIKLSFSSASGEVLMDFDPERIKDILSNLISNAIKFTSHNGEVQITATRQTRDSTAFLVLTISDTGTGISKEDISHVFEPYYRGKNRGESIGTGLGLATTRQWINAMGGQIQVTSTVGKGTTFTVEIPITNMASQSNFNDKQNHSSAELLATPWPLDIDHKQQECPTILLVEDHIDVVNYIRLCLTEFSVVHAADGEEGINQAIEEVPDLVITDIMMPIKDGYEVCAILRSHKTTSHIPIIMLTAKATQEEKRQGLSLGADAYLTKPFDQKELIIRVKGLLSQRRLLQEKYSQRFDKSSIQPDDVEDEFLNQIQQFVDTHLDQDLTVEDVAAAVRMSRVQLYRKVKALTGKSVSLYIRLIRLHHARQLLLSSQKNVSEVAYETGFSDPSYFSRAFKEEFSVSPTELRNK
ncbi:MAG: response regulator, partial [Saprospiraceae bacterium]|nr:response regulator [Saprospiraceae bacterium]